MKTYKELTEEILSEGHNRYPGDDMTMKELKIACNAAKNIIEMLEDGAELQRWQISAIVVASDELASVCTSMRVDHDEQMEDEMEMEYDEYGYPSMFGEEVELDEAKLPVAKIQKMVDDGKSMDVIVGTFANKRTTNTDEIRQVVKDYKWKKAMKKESAKINEAQIDKMKFISKGFSTRPAAERHNDSLVGKNKASHQSYIHKHENGKYYVVDLK